MTEFEQYFTSLIDGKIVACEKMKRVAETLLENFVNLAKHQPVKSEHL